MSCHDWRALLAHRFDPAVGAPEDWSEAEAHLEVCQSCRRTALAIDPTLAFRSAATWQAEPGEIVAIRQAVRTLRRASALDARGDDAGGPTRHIGPRAAAALFALVLALHPSTTARNPAEPAPAARGPRLVRVTGPVAPAIEGVDRPDARVYEWGADDLSVVMVVDESMDV
jgi:hypothetical protein